MRVVKEISHQACKITVFSWNQKYLIKLEQGDFEQTFKVSELDILEEELDEILSDRFVNLALQRFQDMQKSLSEALRVKSEK